MSRNPLPVALPDRSAPALHRSPWVESRAATIAAVSLVSAAARDCNSVAAYSWQALDPLSDFLQFLLRLVEVATNVADQLRFVSFQQCLANPETAARKLIELGALSRAGRLR
jgi:hypothetical protein